MGARARALLLCLLAGATVGTMAAGRPPDFDWQLPPGFPAPHVPADNPMTPEKARLGRYLFYDTRLSTNGTYSCASCHEQAKAFTDGRAQAVGATGELHPRGSMSLVNIAYASALTWANPGLSRLEDQALVPMFGEQPVELGLTRSGGPWLERLRSVAEYKDLFPKAFPAAVDPFTVDDVARAIASFERTIIAGRSPYDRYHYDRIEDAISPAARRGEQLFFSRPMSCFRCHNGFTFSGAVTFEGREAGAVELHNTGLYNLAGALSYPPSNAGLYEITRQPQDVGKFKAPTLRNVAITGPYMHDGSIATLEQVLDHYAAGGRTIADGPYSGVGHDNPNKSPVVRGFAMSTADKTDLLAFLTALTDDTLLHDQRFSNPWER